MSNSIALVAPAVRVIVGVDTHKHVHVAVAIDRLGTRLASCRAPADRAGYAELLAWARTLGNVEAFGIEGTGSYGVGLASFVCRHAVRVVEVNHCDRRKRRNHGKNDTIDADTAARAVLAGIRNRRPKDRRRGLGDGPPAQSRPRYGRESQEFRDHHAQDADR